jgi:hypothetical protein
MLLDVIEKQTDKLERRVKRTALYTQIGSETVDLLDAFSM